MKEKTHAADYYRRMLSVQPHSLKRLDPFAAIVKCHRGQEIRMIQDLRATGITLSLARSGAAQSARTGGDKSSI
jgi:hypothetical protein